METLEHHIHEAMRLDETTALVLSSLRDFARRELPDEQLVAWDEGAVFPAELVRRILAEDLGLALLFIPEEFGGLGAGAVTICRVCESLASVDLGLATSVLATALGIDPIRVGATPEQKDQWLTRIADEGLLVAYAVTEPGAGSNVAALKSKAEPIVEDGRVTAWKLNGTKVFITNGGVADLYSVLARTPSGASFFVVERDRPGLTPGREENKHGIRLSNTAEVILEDVVVPADHLIGIEEGNGLKQASQVFGYTRLMVASFAVGVAAEAMRRAVAYARERVQFDSPLLAKQGYTHTLILPHLASLQAARAFILQTAQKLDQGGEDLPVEASAAKYFASEAAVAATDAAVQALGGYGYMREFLLEKLRRDAKITTIYEGTSEIQREIVGRGRWRADLATRGAFYSDLGAEMERLASLVPAALPVADAARAAGVLFRRARKSRLGRRQQVVFELGELAAWVETAASLVRTAAWLSSKNHPQARDFSDLAHLQAGRLAAKTARTAASILEGSEAASLAELSPELDVVRLLSWHRGTLAAADRLAARLWETDLADAPLATPSVD